MEEKKFPWLLRLLSLYPCNVQLLETYAIQQEKVVASFTNDFSNNIIQTNSKNLPFNTTYKCLDYLSSQQSMQAVHSIKHTYFRYKGQNIEISKFLLSSYKNKRKSLPPISYIQASREPLQLFITCLSESSKNSIKTTIFPLQSNNSITTSASLISSEIISLIQQQENKKVAKIKLEFFVDKTFKLFLCFMNYCVLFPLKKECKSFTTRSNVKSKTSFKNQGVSFNDRVLAGQFDRNQMDRSQVDDNALSELDEESSDSLKESSGTESEDKEEKIDFHDNFIELICNTRIVSRSLHRKLWISDEELEHEKNSVCGIIEEAMRVRNNEKNLWQKNSNKYRKYNSKATFGGLLFNSESIKMSAYKKHGSQIDVSLPFLSHTKRNTMF